MFSQTEFEGSSLVGMQTDIGMELTKQQDGTNWQTNACFEMTFSSPYASNIY